MKTYGFFIAFLALIYSSAYASEMNKYNVEGHVWLVKTSGTWGTDKNYGYYRVIVTRGGDEHSHDHVYVQILSNNFKNIKTVELESPGYQGYVRDITFNTINSNKMAISLEIEMKGMFGIEQNEIFTINQEGKVNRIAEPKWVDIE